MRKNYILRCKQLRFTTLTIARFFKRTVPLNMVAFGCLLNSPFTTHDIFELKTHFLQNITEKGAVIASPSKSNPDYYYHWVRDGAIAMSLVEDWYEKDLDIKYQTFLFNYVSWVDLLQHATPTSGADILGEPKFFLTGRVFDGEWGRPQNDGAALRAITLMRFANTLLINKDNQHYVAKYLYSPTLNFDTMGVIKRDLEYIAHHWQDPHIDLWEETYGLHFFSSMVQHLALQQGAKLALTLNDITASDFYTKQAELITVQLNTFIDRKTQQFIASRDSHGPKKEEQLDASIILGVLKSNQAHYTVDNPVLDNTVKALYKHFKIDFFINASHENAILFGRYPGDTYDGHHTDALGNPWFILTATMAEYHFERARLFYKNNEEAKKIIEEITRADEYLALIKHFAPTNHLSEQINRDTGEQQGAVDLTWSYQSLLHALLVRNELIRSLHIGIIK